MLIKVAEQIGKNAVTQRAGQKLFEMIQAELRSGRQVIIDFSGVEVYSSPFFNNSIGRLFADIDEDAIRKHLVIANITQNGEQVVRRVIENAKAYYSLTPDERQRQDDVSREFFDSLDGL